MGDLKKVAVILGGCGFSDGSEIHEATLTLLTIVQNGGVYEIFAPDIEQFCVMNNITKQPMKESRNVLVESARIARGKIRPLNKFKAEDFDVLIIPGGSGTAKNLFTYKIDGVNCKVNKEVSHAILSMVKLKKPVGALCIGAVLMARVLGDVKVTVGQDLPTAIDIEKMGATNIPTRHGEIAIDEQHKVVTTPCYMLDSNIAQIYDGINNLVKELFKLAS